LYANSNCANAALAGLFPKRTKWDRLYINIDSKVIKAAFDELISPAPTKPSEIRVEINNELDKLTDKELKTVLLFIKKRLKY